MSRIIGRHPKIGALVVGNEPTMWLQWNDHGDVKLGVITKINIETWYRTTIDVLVILSPVPSMRLKTLNGITTDQFHYLF